MIMEHNLHDVAAMARYAQTHGLEVFYQPIEQNYNTPEDPTWFEHSDNWPKDRERAVAAVQELIELKRQGLPIANSEHQLEVMIPYFRDPRSLLILTQSHRPTTSPSARHSRRCRSSPTATSGRAGAWTRSATSRRRPSARSGKVVRTGGNRDVAWDGGCRRPRKPSWA